MDRQNMLISDGYVGSFGTSWHTPTARQLERAIVGAMEIERKTREEIVAILEAGGTVRWCKSLNFYYDHNYGQLETKRKSPPVIMVRCSCGHSVPRTQVMSASRGSSCPDCYDRMSD